MARKLDGLWLAQQLGAHDDYAPHRVQTRPCGHSLYEAEMLLQMHAAYPAPFFACVTRRPDLCARPYSTTRASSRPSTTCTLRISRGSRCSGAEFY
jgi:hypothetical protein